MLVCDICGISEREARQKYGLDHSSPLERVELTADGNYLNTLGDLCCECRAAIISIVCLFQGSANIKQADMIDNLIYKIRARFKEIVEKNKDKGDG